MFNTNLGGGIKVLIENIIWWIGQDLIEAGVLISFGTEVGGRGL